MTYVVLARRWRPQQFDDIIGQNHVSKTLSNAIETNRIAHSYIFSGPRGVGKTTTARILAKALNCEKGPIPTPCNKCSVCEMITKGNSLDVLEIDGASNRGIDEVRNLRENIRFTPSQGKYRIYIIDEVHMLTKEAFNALLKTLEEPPQHVVFIFATTEIHRVPATILSRCQRFDFKRIPTKTIIDHLSTMCSKEKIDIENDALLQIAKKADGSLRDSQSILDQIISYTGEKITLNDVSEALGIIDQELFFEFTNKILSADLKDLLLLCQRVISEGYDIGEFLVGFEEHFRNILVTKSMGNVELINVSEHYQERYLQETANFHESDLLKIIQQIGELQNAMKWAVQPQVKFELGILKLAKLPKTVDIETLLEKLELLKKKNNKPALNLNQSKSESQEEKTDFNLESIQKYWPHLVEHFKNSKVNLANALDIAKPLELEDSTLTIQYFKVDSFHISWLKKNKRIVEDHLYKHFKNPLKIAIKIIDGERKSGKDSKKNDLHEMINEDPLMNKLIDELGLELT